MRARTRIVLGAAIAASAMVLGFTGPVSADPPNGGPTTLSKNDITGVGSDTTQEVMASFSQGWNNTRQDGTAPDGPPFARSWDAVGSTTIDPDGSASGCAAITRPNGSSSGISALLADTSSGSLSADNNQCLDYARSSRARKSSDPATISFIGYARDVVTWAAFADAGTAVPANLSLTTAQLRSIYQCTITNWNQVGGSSGTIVPVLPQIGSGTRDFWLTSIGVTTPGACVVNGSRDGTLIQENSGTAVRNVLSSSEEQRAIFPYSVGNWVSQRDPGGIATDERSSARLNRTNATDPLTGGNNQSTGLINPSANYSRVLYNVVKETSTGAIPGYLRAFLVDYVCANDVEGRAVLSAYGFASLGTGCGVLA